MPYSLYRLNFSTGLHIGTSNGGPSLDSGEMTIHSDTIFSALCCDCGDEDRNRLYSYFAQGNLMISGANPFQDEEYFLPKPIIPYTGKRQEPIENLSGKIFKKIKYIPLTLFDEYLGSLAGETVLEPERIKNEFGKMSLHERVAITGQEQSLPYYVGVWRFFQGTGLYLILQYKENEVRNFFTERLKSLGLSGIGGKRASGLGKFQVEECELPQKLSDLLEDEAAEYHMLLGTALPKADEINQVLEGSWYSVVRRGGFVQSESYAVQQRRKRTIYMLGPGSCLKTRFEGEIFDLSEGGSHPVWRCGKSIFLGVRL